MKTTSKYIGPCSASQAIGHTTRNSFYETGVFDEKESDEETLNDLRKVALETRTRAAKNQRQIKSNSPPKNNTPKKSKNINLTKKKKVNYEKLKSNHILKSKYYTVSERNLTNNISKVFEKMGLDPENSSEITIKHGNEINTKKTLTGNYIITVPKKKGMSQRLRTEVLRCGARLCLEQLEISRNEVYREVEETFKMNYKLINEGIAKFINLTNKNQRTAEAKTIALKYFGNSSFFLKLSKNFKYTIKPSSLGLVDFHSKRKTWKDDFVQVFTESLFSKYDLEKQRLSQINRTKQGLAKSKKDYEELPKYQLVKRARIKRNIQKNEARLLCLKASLDNIQIIKKSFKD